MFDEVYHAFTAVEMNRGNLAAWEWWNTPPQGFAYEWTHPPLAKEAMGIGIKLLGPFLPLQTPRVDSKQDPNPFAWRFPVALAGVGVIYLIYLLGRELFSERVGLIAALLSTFEGLNFVQSRIGMNDTFFLFCILLSFYLFLRQKWWGMGVALGLSLVSKWTALYGIGILGFLYLLKLLLSLIIQRRVAKESTAHASSAVQTRAYFSGSPREFPARQLAERVSSRFPLKLAKLNNADSAEGRREYRGIVLSSFFIFLFSFLIIPVLVYLLCYFPFFRSGHTWQQFDELQHQMWWYHTRLKATHPFTSPWYSWPFLYRPVWYYVNYNPGGVVGEGESQSIANIYAMGNPVIWWGGMVAIGWMLVLLARRAAEVGTKIFSGTKDSFLKNFVPPRSSQGLIIVLLGYFGFFLPWAFSPRIMFLYHYLPSIPFMCLALGYGLDKIWQDSRFKIFAICYLLFAILSFVYFYPHYSGLPVPKWLDNSYYWFPSWR
jgi:dolichyl-phosphate-mannose--protein O-mannosyl transferase